MAKRRKTRRNAELTQAHKDVAARLRGLASVASTHAQAKARAASTPGEGVSGTVSRADKKRLADEAEFLAARAERLGVAAERVAALSAEQVAPLAKRLKGASEKTLEALAADVNEAYARRQAYEEGVNEYLRQKAASLPSSPLLRAVEKGSQGALFEPKKYKLQTLTPGEQGSLFAPSPVSLPASAIKDRVKLDAKRAERFERDKRTRESILAQLGETVRATGQAIALEGPRGNVLAVVRLTAENGRRGRRKPASCYCVRKNAKRPPLEGARIELTRAESERWHARDAKTVAEVLAAARAAVTETGRPVTVRDVDGVAVAVAVAKMKPRR